MEMDEKSELSTHHHTMRLDGFIHNSVIARFHPLVAQMGGIKDLFFISSL
jgi:hypothetical protein